MSFIETIRENSRKLREAEKAIQEREKIKQTEFNVKMVSVIRGALLKYSEISESGWLIEFNKDECFREWRNSPYYNNTMMRYIADYLKDEGFEVGYCDGYNMSVSW